MIVTGTNSDVLTKEGDEDVDSIPDSCPVMPIDVAK